MHEIINGIRIWFDVDGSGFVPDGLRMRQRLTLVLGGDLDPVTPLADQDDIAAAIPPVHERFADAGHGVGHDQPERYRAVLRDVLAGL